jgi:UDP-N-acetylglucosamine transferase subunit ALG13
MIDLISPSKTGMGLEIIRTKKLADILLRNKISVRVWTFHPNAFNEIPVAIIPLQESTAPVTPHCSEIKKGAFWEPHSGENGPYVCNTALTVSRERGMISLDDKNLNFETTGSLPLHINQTGKLLVDKFQCIEDSLVKGNEIADYIVINLISAHGSGKGLTNLDSANEIVKRLSELFPHLSFIYLINANTSRGSKLPYKLSSNVNCIVHYDNDIRINKIINDSRLVISVEGGLIHCACDLNKKFVMLSTYYWFKQVCYLYENDIAKSICFVEDYSVKALVQGCSEILASSGFNFN